jgi:hypothetical protein
MADRGDPVATASLFPQVYDPQRAGQLRDLQEPLRDEHVLQMHGLRAPESVSGSVPPPFQHLLIGDPVLRRIGWLNTSNTLCLKS